MIDDLSDLRTKFQNEQENFGLYKQDLKFVQLIRYAKYDKICGKIINQMQNTMETQTQFTVYTKQQIIKIFKKERQTFDKLYSSIDTKFSKKDKKKGVNLNQHKLFGNSKIIQKDQDRQLLNKLLCQVVKDEERLLEAQLLFRASQNQFSNLKFHQKCNGKNNTMTIIKNQFDKIIGGFTSKAWKDSEGGQWIQDQIGSSFLFSLSMKEKFQNNISPHLSICCVSSYGPTFGGGHDLCIMDKSNQNRNSYSNILNSYNSKANKYEQTQQTYTLFTGSPNDFNFKVKQYEVYQIKL